MIANPPKAAGHLRIVSFNVNGLRAAVNKGFLAWLTAFDVDIICLQETRLNHTQWLDTHRPEGWHTALAPAQRAGYAGVAIYSRLPFETQVGCGIDWIDAEGRCLRGHFEIQGHSFSVVSLYVPSGSMGEVGLARKDQFLLEMAPVFDAWSEHPTLICTDINIAHRDIDLSHPQSSRGCPGTLPHERAWFDRRLVQGWVDVFRTSYPEAGHYSWFSYRHGAWEKNAGWRIDYQLASAHWPLPWHQGGIYRMSRFSDHAPVWFDYALPH